MEFDCRDKTKAAVEYYAGQEQKLLEHLPPVLQEYVVLVTMVVDTAIILAASDREAADMYEFPEELKDKDIALWAMTRAEFDEMVKTGECPDKTEPKP